MESQNKKKKIKQISAFFSRNSTRLSYTRFLLGLLEVDLFSLIDCFIISVVISHSTSWLSGIGRRGGAHNARPIYAPTYVYIRPCARAPPLETDRLSAHYASSLGNIIFVSLTNDPLTSLCDLFPAPLFSPNYGVVTFANIISHHVAS